jgi:hypothetical protein
MSTLFLLCIVSFIVALGGCVSALFCKDVNPMRVAYTCLGIMFLTGGIAGWVVLLFTHG